MEYTEQLNYIHKRTRLGRWVKIVWVTILMSICALSMAALAVLTMDQPELSKITNIAWFCTFVFTVGAIGGALEPD